MTEVDETFYTPQRWQNWLARVADAELDPTDEAAARVVLNMQDDAAIAVAKIVTAYEEDRLDADAALAELQAFSDVVLARPAFDPAQFDVDADRELLLEGVQTSLVCVCHAAEQYIREGAVDGGFTALVGTAAAAVADEDLDEAYAAVVAAGTRLFVGDSFDPTPAADVEYGLLIEWLNGLDSLANALMAPEPVDAA
ncbi:MAG: DUF2150 family protein [Haloferacaceae archaeon]|nr:DUF2150 family protein [Haloferacaceae archaeon]